MPKHAKHNSAARDTVAAHSAGGVVVRGEGPDLRVAVMRSRYGTWVFPKGGIEEGETPEQAAVRELQEEVGLTGLVLQRFVSTTQHEFDLHGTHYRKRVDWFLFTAPPETQLHAQPEHGALDAGWFTKPQALRLLTHVDQRRVLRRALSPDSPPD